MERFYECKRLLERPGHGWGNNIEIANEIVWYVLNGIDLSQDTNSRGLSNMILDRRVQ